MRTIGHGGRMAAPEIALGLLAPNWRVDPVAQGVLGPIMATLHSVRHQHLQLDQFRTLCSAVRAGHGRRAGPIFAAISGLQQLGLGDDLEQWPVPGMPQSFMPLQQHPAEVRRVLLKAWMHSQAIRVAERRQDFTHLQPGFDRWATLQIFQSQQLDECHKGALRAVIMGNIVTQKTASRWTGVATCPYCTKRWRTAGIASTSARRGRSSGWCRCTWR